MKEKLFSRWKSRNVPFCNIAVGIFAIVFAYTMNAKADWAPDFKPGTPYNFGPSALVPKWSEVKAGEWTFNYEGALTKAKAEGKYISVDPNLRKPLWNQEADAKEAIEWSLRQADIVKISDEEIEFLWGMTPEAGAQKLLNEYGVSLVYATLGPKGCHAATKKVRVTVDSPKGIRVVDTTGAGDIFGGSAMSRLLKLNKKPDELTEDELRDIVSFACTAASLSTQKHGGISSVPEEDEVLRMVGK